jgi:hypothetical protein
MKRHIVIKAKSNYDAKIISKLLRKETRLVSIPNNSKEVHISVMSYAHGEQRILFLREEIELLRVMRSKEIPRLKEAFYWERHDDESGVSIEKPYEL